MAERLNKKVPSSIAEEFWREHWQHAGRHTDFKLKELREQTKVGSNPGSIIINLCGDIGSGKSLFLEELQIESHTADHPMAVVIIDEERIERYRSDPLQMLTDILAGFGEPGFLESEDVKESYQYYLENRPRDVVGALNRNYVKSDYTDFHWLREMRSVENVFLKKIYDLSLDDTTQSGSRLVTMGFDNASVLPHDLYCILENEVFRQLVSTRIPNAILINTNRPIRWQHPEVKAKAHIREVEPESHHLSKKLFERFGITDLSNDEFKVVHSITGGNRRALTLVAVAVSEESNKQNVPKEDLMRDLTFLTRVVYEGYVKEVIKDFDELEENALHVLSINRVIEGGQDLHLLDYVNEGYKKLEKEDWNNILKKIITLGIISFKDSFYQVNPSMRRMVVNYLMFNEPEKLQLLSGKFQQHRSIRAELLIQQKEHITQNADLVARYINECLYLGILSGEVYPLRFYRDLQRAITRDNGIPVEIGANILSRVHASMLSDTELHDLAVTTGNISLVTQEIAEQSIIISLNTQTKLKK